MKMDQNLIDEFNKISDSQELIHRLFERFGKRAAIGTSGQLTGVVMIDQAVRSGIKPRVFTIDTQRLFKETYELFDEIEKKYDFKVERIQPDPVKIQEMVQEHGEHLFFDSKEKQELCCRLRKVVPNAKVLETLDVWISGLRADQSKSREKTSRFEIITQGPGKRPILKVSPLVDWTEAMLRDYIRKHDVPVHKLLLWQKSGWYYESLGCVICTTPIGPNESRRAGRWRWFHSDDSKECGLHVSHPDEV